MSYDADLSPKNAPNETSQKQTLLERFRRLTHQQRTALRELLPLARAGLLYGCTCAEDGVPLPCEHCLDAVDPEEAMVLDLMRQAEQRGLHRWNNLAAVNDRIAHSTENYPDHVPSLFPLYSTAAEPGSPEKIAVLEERIEHGCAVYRRGDRADSLTRFDGEAA